MEWHVMSVAIDESADGRVDCFAIVRRRQIKCREILEECQNVSGQGFANTRNNVDHLAAWQHFFGVLDVTERPAVPYACLISTAPFKTHNRLGTKLVSMIDHEFPGPFQGLQYRPKPHLPHSMYEDRFSGYQRKFSFIWVIPRRFSKSSSGFAEPSKLVTISKLSLRSQSRIDTKDYCYGTAFTRPSAAFDFSVSFL